MEVQNRGPDAGAGPLRTGCIRRLRGFWLAIVAAIAFLFAVGLLAGTVLVQQRTLDAHAKALGRLKTCVGCSVDESVSRATLRLLNSASGDTATGFLHACGKVITAKHCVEGTAVDDLVLIDCAGRSHRVAAVMLCDLDDLALITLTERPDDLPGLSISSQDLLSIGYPVTLLGYPAGYSGFGSLATVGHISGLDRDPETQRARLVLNAAINLGNSGGPVLLPGERQVSGLAVAKMIPVPIELKAALKALKCQRKGTQYVHTSPDGKQRSISETQVLAGILEYQQRQTQLAIGFAVPAASVREFLTAQGIQP